MGIIRKTVSISTLGLVSFRSKKERLRRAETAYQEASEELAATKAARAAADDRVADAERRARTAEMFALREAKVARRRGRKLKEERDGRSRRARRKAAKRAQQRAQQVESTLRSSVGDLVAAAQPLVEDGAKAAKRGGRSARRRAEHAARRAERHMSKRVKPRLEEAAAAARDRATELADKARDRVDA